MVKQCGILFIGLCGSDAGRLAALRSLGFRVGESEHLPSTDELTHFQAVIVRALPGCPLPMVGTRLRAKRHFGRRALIALTGPAYQIVTSAKRR